MRRFVVSAASAILLLATSAFAHHSYGEFDRDHPITVEGVVQQVVLGNPHAIIQVRTDKNIVYTAEWGNALQLARTGVKAGTLRAGDRVVLTGSPLKDPSFHTISLVTEIRRPADGWRWLRTDLDNENRSK
jgi:hypothetical protein